MITQTHRHPQHEYSSSLGPSWQLRSGWAGKLGLGWQVEARLTDTNNNNNDNFLKGTVLGDKEQGVGMRNKE